jgi:AAA domain
MQNQKLKDFKFKFAVPTKNIIVQTGMMLEVIERTKAVHPGNSLWYGESRLGKTTTAQFMVQKIEEAYDPQNPHAYRAVHYEVGGVGEWTGNEIKKGIKSLYYATLGRIDEGVYRHDPAESIATQLVYGLRRKNIQIVFIDEAGTLSLEAIRGIVLVGDVAKNMNYPLSFVFVGMDDLPTKVQYLPQVSKRIVEWCYFEAYSLEETAKLLSCLHTHFAQLDPNNPREFEQIETVYEMFGGFPGLIVPFLKKLDRYQQEKREEITVKYLRATHMRTLFDEEQAVKKSLEKYQGRPPKDSRSGFRQKAGAQKGGEQTDAKKTNKKKSRKRSGK